MHQKYEIQEIQPPKSASHLKSLTNTSMDSTTSPTTNFQSLMLQHSQPPKFGNIHILYQNERFLFTIGPDYICFLLGYLFFTILNIAIIYFAATQIKNIYVNIVNVLVSMIQNLSYLAVALSNPGIETKNTIPTEEDVSDQIKRFCKQCEIRMQKGTHHCRDCNVCIRNYDHHCPWTSKCIGEKNLFKFYFFVASTLIYIVYCLVMLIVCLANNALQYENSASRNKMF